ncbi:MAG: excinuclease ABC subunit UvrA [Bryobacteraceae bacterium]|nr:excinuclease ABC subunit UvrA [Bryobacteraceae bacterium]
MPQPTGAPALRIRGARVHNLKNVFVEIPHNQLTVVTGVSGSGKSSLVFDTIYAEGQRRYVESLSSYARQFLERMEKPDIDEIEGIAPPIAIRQRNTTRNPRSTVATSTEIYDFMRLLWARTGITYCPNGHGEVRRDTVDHVAARMLEEAPGSRWYALFPVKVPATTAQALRDRLFDLRAKGFNRLYQNGRTFEFSTPESILEIDFKKPVFALVDRLAMTEDIRQRVVDTVEICYREGGEVVFEEAGAAEPKRLRFAETFECKACGTQFVDPEPQLFSFNNPFGACPRCQGFGNTVDYDMDLVVPDPTRSLDEGAIDPWTKPNYSWFFDDFKKSKTGPLTDKRRWKVPFAELTAAEKKIVRDAVFAFFAEIEEKKYKVHVRVFLSRYRGYAQCPDCGGSRLREAARNVRVAGRTVSEAAAMNIGEAARFFDSLTLAPEHQKIADRIVLEIRQRLKFLNDVGLDYLTLDRLASTLSGGEAQRIQLATCLGSRLVGATYVLDEPSIGLHQRDTGRLIGILHELRDLGNTIVVVEHDPEVMRAADWIVDLGPAAGERGGEVVYAGTFAKMNGTLTSRYLSGELSAAPKRARRKIDKKRSVTFRGARVHNIKGIDVTIPLDALVAVTGVSGSGKSSLVHEVIHKTLDQRLRQLKPDRAPAGDPEMGEKVTCRAVERAELVGDCVLVDQSPIGRTPRSNPVTYIKAFDQIRELFAATPEAKRRGYTAGHFSFNIPGGRCETCQGDGTVTVEMQFLADVELICEDCKGTRYKPSLLEIRYKDRSIHEVLGLTIDDAVEFFSDTPKLAGRLRVLAEIGLGYLRLGQSATTLSGGEAQRVKLGAYIANTGQTAAKGTLFIFDEPTTGLHFDDIAKLLDAFHRLIDQGASVLLIEHNLDVIRAADWVIDLGPEGGAAGGKIVAVGTPPEIAKVAESHTGRALRGS